ncbi:MAG: hypothetical protein Q8P45_01260 [Candidatus Harrisonbacteria bacterium]|nr:hypothetical protein [Candidatus Harrisonbacteria bacterium]
MKETIALAIALFLIAGFIILWFVLNFHWRKYEVSAQTHKKFRRLYLLPSLFLILVMIMSYLLKS